MTLDELEIGQSAIIKAVNSFRLLEYGFTPDTEIIILNKLLFNGAISIYIRGAIIALRRTDCKNIIMYT